MSDLLMIRHGQSVYNLENRFTGWVDVPLSEQGIKEAKEDAEKLKDYKIDVAYTSKLIRAIDTLHFILDVNKNKNIPVVENAALNERNYGDLQGLNKAEVAKKYGDEQVHIWRRSYEVAPPGGESLKDTSMRAMPFYNSFIAEDLKRGLNVLLVAHGNSLRAIIKELDGISDEDIANLNLETGKIYLYRFDKNLKIISKSIL
ncbi:MAG TPA: 2,3-diphosphoglycerate-dependent phosphoglycerate mutase [Hanamia sp.]|nr:2,3-diphosphoglycerate-dependent phosphoglycerate mutase [Hanamia sp.]